jgi:hypothetical protein
MRRETLASRQQSCTLDCYPVTVELIIFGVASGWVIYQEQLEAFREIKGQPFSLNASIGPTQVAPPKYAIQDWG